MGIYEEYLERKENGEKLDINSLTRDELKTIWYDEVHFDPEIARLFDVTTSHVKTLRKRMELTLQDIQFDERVKFVKTLGDASVDVAATVELLSKRDRDQFERMVHELSEWFKKNKDRG